MSTTFFRSQIIDGLQKHQNSTFIDARENTQNLIIIVCNWRADSITFCSVHPLRFPYPEEPVLTVCPQQVLVRVLGQPNHILLMHLEGKEVLKMREIISSLHLMSSPAYRWLWRSSRGWSPPPRSRSTLPWETSSSRWSLHLPSYQMRMTSQSDPAWIFSQTYQTYNQHANLHVHDDHGVGPVADDHLVHISWHNVDRVDVDISPSSSSQRFECILTLSCFGIPHFYSTVTWTTSKPTMKKFLTD